jgi:nitrite reductase/ring-hydroxylating ferredoxin subunit
MLSREENRLLTQIEPGTPMGNLFRRYWIPALLTEELPEPDSAPVRVRLLAEDLVAFRASDHKIGLLGEHCAHRGTSLFFGRNEECGLRCLYHGWKIDVDGNIVERPSDLVQARRRRVAAKRRTRIVCPCNGPLVRIEHAAAKLPQRIQLAIEREHDAVVGAIGNEGRHTPAGASGECGCRAPAGAIPKLCAASW